MTPCRFCGSVTGDCDYLPPLDVIDSPDAIPPCLDFREAADDARIATTLAVLIGGALIAGLILYALVEVH